MPAGRRRSLKEQRGISVVNARSGCQWLAAHVMRIEHGSVLLNDRGRAECAAFSVKARTAVQRTMWDIEDLSVDIPCNTCSACSANSFGMNR